MASVFGMFRRFSTSRAAKALSVDDWAALNSAFPSSPTVTNILMNATWTAAYITAFTGAAVVCASDWLQKCRSAELQAEMKGLEIKMDSLDAKVDTKLMSLDAKFEIVMGKLSSIEEQLAKTSQVQGKGTK